jgi:hypothetical protein
MSIFKSKKHISFNLDSAKVDILEDEDALALDQDFNKGEWDKKDDPEKLEISRTLHVSKGTYTDLFYLYT